jgi:hypothetical protein
MGTRPQTIGYGLDWAYTRSEPERALTRDEILDEITLY